MNDFMFLHYSKDRITGNHFHDGYELFLPINDGGHLFINDTRYDLHRGALYCIKPYELHRCFCKDEEQTDRYVLSVPIESLEKMSTAKTDFINAFQDAPRCSTLNEASLKRFSLFEQDLERTQRNEFGDDVKRELYFQNFVLMIAKWMRSKEYADVDIRPEGSQRILPILRYIHKHLAEELSLEKISKEFFLSKSRLNQVFRSVTGFSVGEYIITCRIKKACMLLNSNMPIQEISSATGFGDPTHFNRTFKKRMGVTPGAYQKSGAGRHAEKLKDS